MIGRISLIRLIAAHHTNQRIFAILRCAFYVYCLGFGHNGPATIPRKYRSIDQKSLHLAAQIRLNLSQYPMPHYRPILGIPILQC